jgi:hypothetical protein
MPEPTTPTLQPGSRVRLMQPVQYAGRQGMVRWIIPTSQGLHVWVRVERGPMLPFAVQELEAVAHPLPEGSPQTGCADTVAPRAKTPCAHTVAPGSLRSLRPRRGAGGAP